MKLFKKLFRPIKKIIEEMKLVEWLTLSQTTSLTLLVLGISAIVTLYIVATSFGFSKAVNFILDLG